MFYIIYLPCLPLSTVIYAPPPARFRIRRGGIHPFEEERPTSRDTRRAPKLTIKGASDLSRSWNDVGASPRPRFCKAGREYVPLSSSEFRGREFLTVSLKPISRDSFPTCACAWWSGRGPSGWVSWEWHVLPFLRNEFRRFSRALGSFYRNEVSIFLARWVLNITNSFPPLCPSTSSKGTNKFPGKKENRNRGRMWRADPQKGSFKGDLLNNRNENLRSLAFSPLPPGFSSVFQSARIMITYYIYPYP